MATITEGEKVMKKEIVLLNAELMALKKLTAVLRKKNDWAGVWRNNKRIIEIEKLKKEEE